MQTGLSDEVRMVLICQGAFLVRRGPAEAGMHVTIALYLEHCRERGLRGPQPEKRYKRAHLPPLSLREHNFETQVVQPSVALPTLLVSSSFARK
jgi:hypothetical protein